MEQSGINWKSSFVGKASVITGNFSIGKGTVPKIDEQNKQAVSGKPWARYGENDDFPELLRNKLQYLSVGNTALDNNADAHFGAFIRWFEESTSPNNKLVKKPVILPEWEEFIEYSNWYEGHANAMGFLEQLYWDPIYCRTSVDKSKILMAYPLDPSFCRKSIRSPTSGRSEYLYYSLLMPNTNGADTKECVKYPIYDHFNYGYDSTEFVFLMEYKTLGMQYYPDPHFYSVFRNKWVDVAIDVPAIINTIFKNETRIKYHVEVPEFYFIKKYHNWEKLPDAEKQKHWENETREMDEFLAGSKDNAGKTFISMYGYDSQNRKIGDISIKPIQEFLDTARDLPTTSEADRQILFAMHNHPEAVGVGAQGGKGLAGSGSGIRNARENQITGFSRDRQASLSFVRFWAKYNKIDLKGAKPYYIDTDTSQTLDENPTGKQTIVSG